MPECLGLMAQEGTQTTAASQAERWSHQSVSDSSPHLEGPIEGYIKANPTWCQLGSDWDSYSEYHKCYIIAICSKSRLNSLKKGCLDSGKLLRLYSVSEHRSFIEKALKCRTSTGPMAGRTGGINRCRPRQV